MSPGPLSYLPIISVVNEGTAFALPTDVPYRAFLTAKTLIASLEAGSDDRDSHKGNPRT